MRDHRIQSDPHTPGRCHADFSSDTYAYRFSLTSDGPVATLRVDRTIQRDEAPNPACELTLSPPAARALRDALALYVECRGLPSEYKLREGQAPFPILHPNGNVTLGEFLSTPSGHVYRCKSLATYQVDPTESFGLLVDRPPCSECGGSGDRVADLALDLADAAALRDGLSAFAPSA